MEKRNALHVLSSSSESSEEESDTDNEESEQSDSDDSVSSSDDEQRQTTEAIEASLQQSFKEGLRLVLENKEEDARNAFEQLSNSKHFAHFHNSRDELPSPNDPKNQTVLAGLFYSAQKNLAELYAKQENQHMNAVHCYVRALKLDSTDVTLWHKLGVEGIKANKMHVSRLAFSQGLEVDPENWLCLDKLICVLFIMNHLTECISFIGSALRLDPLYKRGVVLRDRIFEMSPALRLQSKDWFPVHVKYVKYSSEEREQIMSKLSPLIDKHRSSLSENTKIEPTQPCVELQSFTLAALGRALVGQYDAMLDGNISLARPLDMSDWLRNKTHTDGIDMRPRLCSTPAADQSEMMETSQDQSVTAIDSSQSSVTAIDSSKDSEPEEIPIDASVRELLQEIVSQVVKKEQEIVREVKKPKQKPTAPPPAKKSKVASKIFQRRSSRNVPGYQMCDDFLVAPKPPPFPQLLNLFLPEQLMNLPESHDIITPLDTSVSMDTSIQIETLPPLQDNDDEIRNFIEEFNVRDIAVIILNLLDLLRRKMTEFSLPADLVDVFVRCYECWRKQVQFLTPMRRDFAIEKVAKHAWMHLLYSELVPTLPNDDKSKRSEYCAQIVRSELSVLASFDEELGCEFCCRALWTQIERTDINNARRIGMLERILDLLEDDNFVLAHCDQKITKETVQKRLVHFEKLDTLSRVNLWFESGDYEKIIPVLQESVQTAKHWSKDTLAQLVLLCQCYAKTNDLLSCVQWITPAFGYAIKQYHKAAQTHKTECLAVLQQLIDLLEMCDNSVLEQVSEATRGSLMQNLVKILILMDNQPRRLATESPLDPISPWLLLYNLSKLHELSNISDSYLRQWYKSSIPGVDLMLATRSLMLLLTGHQKLGQSHWCTKQQGRLLLTLVSELRSALQHPLVLAATKDFRLKKIKDNMLSAAEQCFYCLYKYPHKKKKHLDEHSCPQIQLDWQRATEVFDFVSPEEPPSFDGYATDTINHDAVEILLRIEALVPHELKPDKLHPKFEEHILTASPSSDHERLVLGANKGGVVGELYHLLADYYLKSQDLERAIRYYVFDLCVSQCEHSIDSWGGMALSRATHIQHKITHAATEDSLTSVLESLIPSIDRACHCFEKSLILDPNYRVLLVEYAGLIYIVRAAISRALKQGEWQRDKVAEMSKRAAELLEKSRELYRRVLDAAEAKASDNERTGDLFVANFFLGKINEKKKESVHDVLSHYYTAAHVLREGGLRFVDKIKYEKAPRFVLEALEIHYRMHATVLKWMTRGRTLAKQDINVIHAYVNAFREHLLHRKDKVPDDCVGYFSSGDSSAVNSTIWMTSSVTDESSASEINQCVDDLVDSVALREQIVHWCIGALKLCIRRFQNHYKSYYWLARAYYILPSVKDLSTAQQVLMGPTRPMGMSQGLFQLRKQNNLFEGVWRLPSDDYERSGSFAMHMERTVKMAIELLIKNQSHELLTQITQALSRAPDKDRKFLHNRYRCSLYKRAGLGALAIVRKQIQEAKTEAELSSICVTIQQKHLCKMTPKFMEKLTQKWKELLVDAFKKRMPNIANPAIAEISKHCNNWQMQMLEVQRLQNIRKRTHPSPIITIADSSEDSATENDSPRPKRPYLPSYLPSNPRLLPSTHQLTVQQLLLKHLELNRMRQPNIIKKTPFGVDALLSRKDTNYKSSQQGTVQSGTNQTDGSGPGGSSRSPIRIDD